MTIVFLRNTDRKLIEDAITDTSFPIVVENKFYSDGPASYTVEAADFDATYQEALKKVVDKVLFPLQSAALVWKMVKSSRTYNLENSYVRDAVSTETPLTALTDETQLKVRFEIPGFSSSNYREIDLWYNDDFNPTDLDLLAEIGISLSGNGAEFTIHNDIECKVSFSKPTASTEIYIIDDIYYNDIIPAETIIL